MVITAVELEGPSVLEGIKIPEIGKFGRKGNGRLFFLPAIQDVDLKTARLKRTRQVGESDRLRPYGGLIEIPDGRLNQENFHNPQDTLISR
jgi:hypothetical protein